MALGRAVLNRVWHLPLLCPSIIQMTSPYSRMMGLEKAFSPELLNFAWCQISDTKKTITMRWKDKAVEPPRFLDM